jgi:hypothetical protein
MSRRSNWLVIALALAALGILRLVQNTVSNTPKVTAPAPVSIRTLDGRGLRIFFEGLEPQPKLARLLVRFQDRSAQCRNSGVLDKVGNALGLTSVVHAQTDCGTSGCLNCYQDVRDTPCIGYGCVGTFKDAWIGYWYFLGTEFNQVARQYPDGVPCQCHYKTCVNPGCG